MQNQGQQFANPMMTGVSNGAMVGAGVGVAGASGVVDGMNAGMAGGMPSAQDGSVGMPNIGGAQDRGMGMQRPVNNMAANVAARIEQASNILVALSKDPNVDEISAALGLTMILDAMGKHVTAIYSGETPNAVKFLNPEKTFETNANSLQDFIIALSKDKADHLRYKVDGDFVKVYITPYKTTITEDDLEFSHGDFNVDLIVALGVAGENDLDAALAEHGRIMHDAGSVNITTNALGKFGEVEWSEPGASSVCEMVTRLVEQFQTKPVLTQEVATALLTGIVANTDRFMNEKTTPEVMGVASRLMQAGANQMTISMNISKDSGPMKMGAQKKEEKAAESGSVSEGKASESKTEEKSEKEEFSDFEKRMEEELAKPLKKKGEQSSDEGKDEGGEKAGEGAEKEGSEGEKAKQERKTQEAKELDELAASVVAAAEESAEKMPGKVPETGARLEIKDDGDEKEDGGKLGKDKDEDGGELKGGSEEKPKKEDGGEEKDEFKSKELLDEKSFEEKILSEMNSANKFGEGRPGAPTEVKVPGAFNVNENGEAEKEDARLLEREEDPEDKKNTEEEKPEEGSTEQEKEEATKKLEEIISAPTMGAMPAELMQNMMESQRLDTTGAKNVHDLARRKKGIVLTEEMTAEDVLGEESAAASEKVLNSDIYPELHDLPEAPVISPTRKKDYGAMMDSELASGTPGTANSGSAVSPIAQAPVMQNSLPNNLQAILNPTAQMQQGAMQGVAQGGVPQGGASQMPQGGQMGLNPAAQMAPQVMNQPEANHIPTMEYIPDNSAGTEMPAQMNGQYLAGQMMPQQGSAPQMAQGGQVMQQVQAMQQPQMAPQMQQPMMQQMPQQPMAQMRQEMPQMQPMQQTPVAQPAQPVQQPLTPQQLAMQVMAQMGPTQQPAQGAQSALMTEISLPVAPAPPIDYSQMMPPAMEAQQMSQMPMAEAQVQQMPVAQPAPAQEMTAGQLVQQNDPSAFRIPGM